MSKFKKNKWISISTAISTLFSTSQVKAIDLQSKNKNVDRSDFNTISSPFKKPLGQYSIIGEVSDTKQPLILKQSNGKTQTLIEGLQAFELSFLHELTDSIQLGILVPGERPYGLIGPYEEAKPYLGNILIEPKVYFSNNIALIPIYYLPSSNQADLQISGQKETLDLGLKNGAYGIKLSMGQKSESGITTAYQIGAIIAPEAKFRDIDQSMKLQFGAGISKELSGGLKLLAEAYGEKYKSNTPLEALAMIEYSNKNFMVRFGGGTGDLQGSGSNTTRMLANFSYYFGNEPKAETNIKLSDKPVSEDEYLKFKKKVEKVEDQLQQEENPLDMKDDKSSTEKQNTPDSGFLNLKNGFPLVELKVKKHKPVNQLPFEDARKLFLDTIDKVRDEHDLSFLKNLSDEEFKKLFFQKMEGKDFGNTISRSIASVDENSESNFLYKVEKAQVSQTAILEIKNKNYHWSESKAKYVMINLRRANASLKENLDLYKIYQSQGKSTEKVLNELNWGIRVFKRNLDSWNLLTSSYMEETGSNLDRLSLNTSVILVNYFDQAVAVLNDNNQKLSIASNKPLNNQTSHELKEAQEFVVKVMTRLNVRKTPNILLNNIIGQLENGDIVRSRSSKIIDNFLEVEIVSSKNLETDFKPLFVNVKYLVPKQNEVNVDQNLTNVDSETLEKFKNVNTIFDEIAEVSSINNDKKAVENINQIKEVLNFNPLNTGSLKPASEASVKEPDITNLTSQKMEEIVQESQNLNIPIEIKNEQSTLAPEEKIEPSKVDKVVDDKKVEKKTTVKPKTLKQSLIKQVEKKKDETINKEQVEEKKASKIEIVYEEVPVTKQKLKENKKTIKKEEKLPEKTVQTVEVENLVKDQQVQKENILKTENNKVELKKEENNSKPVENVTNKIEVNKESINDKSNQALINKTEVKESNKIEVVTPIDKNDVKIEEKTENKISEKDSLQVKIEEKKKELDAIEKLIEMKKSKKSNIDTQLTEQTTVETKSKAKSSEDVFDQVINQKTEDYKKNLENRKTKTPDQEDPLNMKTEGTTIYQNGPSFDEE